MTELQKGIADMTAEQRRASLARLVQEQFGKLEMFPASEGQRRLWLARKLDPGGAVFNFPAAFATKHPLDADILERSLHLLVERHAALRTTFRLSGNSLKQLVRQRSPFTLERVDAASWPQERVLERLSERAFLPFDLEKDPAFRATLFHRGSVGSILLLNWHHIVTDGWSLTVMLGELSFLYSAISRGEEPRLPFAPPYSDFALEQDALLASDEGKRYAEDWRALFEDAPPLRIPGELLPDSKSAAGAGVIEFSLPRETYAKIREHASQASVTPFVFLLAGFQTLLYRHTGQSQIAIQFPMTGRQTSRFGGSVGYFVNMALAVARISGESSFANVLQEVNRQVRLALERQAYPSSHVLGDGGLGRFSGVCFALQSLRQDPDAGFDLGGIPVEPLRLAPQTSGFPLEIQLFETDSRLGGVFLFDRSRFDDTDVRALAERYEALLSALAADPNPRIQTVDICPAAEKDLQLLEWNRAQRVFPSRSLYDLFAEQASKSPDAPAIFHEDEIVSYRDLLERSQIAASNLRSIGVGRDVPVALLLPRSIDAVAWMLGTLAAGGAYVPLDPNHPTARIAAILEDVSPAAVVTTEILRNRLPSTFPNVLEIDTAAPGSEFAADGSTPEGLAYVLYTSGSTGRPKGVAIEHRSAAALVQWAREQFSSAELAGVLASTPFTFDLSIFELFVPLSSGGSVVLVENLLALPASKRARQVTLINTVPTLAKALLQAGPLPASVRVVNLAGEPLSPSLVRQVYAAGSVEKVYDLYGPTEDTTYSTFALRRPDGPQTVGRPVAGTQTYILDNRQRPVPIGVAGELYLAGDGLARCYWNDAALTAERFVPNPFSADAGARMYHTGDRARYRWTGDIELLGRTDQQVKLRGVRIELGEVESALRAHEGVEDAVALVQPIRGGEPALVGYFTASSEPPPSASDLARFLSRRLPRSMVPTLFVARDCFPRTANGKIDHDALAPPESANRGESKPEALAPRSRIEAKLLAIWRTALEISEIGVDDDFFDLGGHSLAAVQIAASICKEFEIQLPASVLLDYPTIAKLAVRVSGDRKGAEWKSLVNLQPRGSKPPLFCFHADSGLILMYKDLAGEMGLDRPIYGLQSVGLGSERQPFQDVASMVKAYVEEIRSVQAAGPYYLAGFCMGAYLALEAARQLELAGERVAFVASFSTDGEWRTREGLAFHARNLSRLEPAKMPLYLIERSAYRLACSISPIVRNLGFLSRRGAAQFPAWARHLEVQEINRRANQTFRPQPFSGKAVVFQGRDESFRDPVPFWSSMAGRGVEVVPIAGKEVGVLRQPNVRILAQRLTEWLEKADAELQPASAHACSA